MRDISIHFYDDYRRALTLNHDNTMENNNTVCKMFYYYLLDEL